MDEKPEQKFLQQRHTDDHRYMKECLTSLIMKEMQIKTIIKYTYICIH